MPFKYHKIISHTNIRKLNNSQINIQRNTVEHNKARLLLFLESRDTQTKKNIELSRDSPPPSPRSKQAAATRFFSTIAPLCLLFVTNIAIVKEWAICLFYILIVILHTCQYQVLFWMTWCTYMLFEWQFCTEHWYLFMTTESYRIMWVKYCGISRKTVSFHSHKELHELVPEHMYDKNSERELCHDISTQVPAEFKRRILTEATSQKILQAHDIRWCHCDISISTNSLLSLSFLVLMHNWCSNLGNANSCEKS